MTIFTAQQIDNSEIYHEVMQNINDLHHERGCPDEFDDDETRRETTTGTQHAAYWVAGEIGDWDGDEEDVAEIANDDLAVVYNGLFRSDDGGVFSYYASSAWTIFVNAAIDIIDEFHSTEAYDVLCGCEWS